MSKKSHYIAVDKDEVMRCNWCGTAESEHWVHKDEGRGVYCSYECRTADEYNSALCTTILFPILWIAIVLTMEYFVPESSWSTDIFTLAIVLGLTFTAFVCCPLSCSLTQLSDSRNARKAVARGSRRFDRVFDERYLKCMNCGAPIDVEGGKTSVDCSYCGVENRVSYSE